MAVGAGLTYRATSGSGEGSDARPVPAAADIADLRVATETACAAAPVNAPLPPQVSTASPSHYVVRSDAPEIVFAKSFATVTVAKGVEVGRMFFCGSNASLNVVGSVETLGVKASDSKIEVSGAVEQVFMDNNFIEAGVRKGYSSMTIKGKIGDMMLHGCDDNLRKDVLVYGELDNALETDDGHLFRWEFGTRAGGDIGHKEVY
ncbi:MAG TPA: hypothetical protein VF572_07240 [Candidatus Saccharimonadales bacterium]